MNLIKLAAQIILIYILYRLVVNFVIPTYRSVSRFKKQFRQMQEEMQRQQEQQQNKFQQTPPAQPAEKTVKSKEGDYIEFEEVKP